MATLYRKSRVPSGRSFDSDSVIGRQVASSQPTTVQSASHWAMAQNQSIVFVEDFSVMFGLSVWSIVRHCSQQAFNEVRSLMGGPRLHWLCAALVANEAARRLFGLSGSFPSKVKLPAPPLPRITSVLNRFVAIVTYNGSLLLL